MAGLALLLGLLLSCVLEASFQPPVLVLAEGCYYPLDVGKVREELGIANVTVDIADEQDVCDDERLIHLISTTPSMVVGSFKPDLCSRIHFISSFRNSTVISWNCPMVYQNIEHPEGIRFGPSISAISAAFLRIFTEMKWRSVAIISSDRGWWPSLAQTIDFNLRELGVVPRHFFQIGNHITKEKMRKKLELLKKAPCSALIMCAPADSTGKKFLDVLDTTQLHHQDIITVYIDVSNLPSWLHLFRSVTNKTIAKNNSLILTENSTMLLSAEQTAARRLQTALLARDASGATFVLASLQLRPLLTLSATDGGSLRVARHPENFGDWAGRHRVTDGCDDCATYVEGVVVMVVVLGSSCLLVSAVVGGVAVARRRLGSKEVVKGPYKVLLAPSDFVFPQTGVDESIEAMLCCWLQQLQEFGGPEVEKPDLLLGSGGASMRTPARTSSSPNLAKQLIVDPRVRYKGDLVQLKPVMSSSSGGDLKSKSVELLVVLHGLRHENLNPLIGCLAEPPRAALVSEYCARGSLQDVLQQDDIKLDWSFRLSLLTDLVRGMKYLHSSPIRVHGYLTSRNCVIDARWVLKLTDYGLPAFYESQGIQPPEKTARDLLWTAPEALRHATFRRTGSQPGDVYSFGIILQEVVVRGEPFCMLALTAEEIIEKIKRPPPLIRPSVSKGAAPPEAINIMRQCWAEQAEMRPDFGAVHEQFKKLNHGRKVNIVDTMFQMLEKYSNNLEELIRERTEQLDVEKKKTEQLLNRMLPSYVADKLKLGMPVDPEEFEEVTIYFSDIVGFTTISAHSTPFQVVDLLNDLYTCFDATINAYNVYKVETIGDAYMVVGGLPVRVPDHAEQVATMALDLLHQSGRFRIRHLPKTPLRLRIGLHSGPCCAGVVGLTMPRYCLFGDTVNTASRMESTGSAWRIHMSEATKIRLERAGGYEIEFRGPTEIKGKGTMDTYWLLGKLGFDKPLPVPPSVEESHGLDESLILSCSPTDEDLQDSLSLDSRPQPPEDQTNKSPRLDPSFIRHMELSKFSSWARTIDDVADHHLVKSSSSETPIVLGTPVSASEVAAALLGASTSSLCGFRRHVKVEEDLSTPYNHYRCLSPKNQKLGKGLRRQFSLDRGEEAGTRGDEHLVPTPRLCKQNSAGAADLEKIEEVPLRIAPSTLSTIQCTLSISVDSLIH